jgi:hypothetical protein
MNDRRRLRLAAAAGVLLAAIAIGACGRRGAPVAPEYRLPATAVNLDGIVRAAGVELMWNLPNRRVDGTPLRDLVVTRVFRVEDSGGESKPALARNGQVVGYREIATIRLASPAPAVVAGGRVTVLDAQALVPGRRYTYVVLSEDAQGRSSPPSSRLSLSFIAAPEAPGNLTAEPGEGEARVAWAAPARLTDGSPLSGEVVYEVLRAPGPEAGLAPIGPPVGVTRIVDRPLENDRAYEYAVRAIRVESQTRAVSEPTTRVSVTPADMTPPSPPADLVAIPSERTVRLSWRGSPEPDVARYVVYRATPGGTFGRVGSVAVPGTTFVDRDVPSGAWRYTVTAEDSGSRRNESARSNAAAVSVP